MEGASPHCRFWMGKVIDLTRPVGSQDPNEISDIEAPGEQFGDNGPCLTEPVVVLATPL